MSAPKLTASQRIALSLFGERRWVFEQDVCTAYIGKQLAALGYVERSTARVWWWARRLHITAAGRAALRGDNEKA